MNLRIAILAVGAGLSLLPADVPAQAGEPTVLQDGAWALQFLIAPDLTLTAFQGGTVALKHHFADHRAIRVGIELNVTLEDDVLHTSTTGSTDRGEFALDKESHLYGLNLQYVAYPRKERALNLYWGLGPSASHSRNFGQDAELVQFGGTGFLHVSVTRRWNAGVMGLLGVEWFPVRQLGIQAEYSAGAELFSNRERLTQRSLAPPFSILSVAARKQDGFTFRSAGVRFGLSAYF